jgi:uncharacterized protein (TIGR00369 family)
VTGQSESVTESKDAALSGREYVEAIVDGREPQPPMLETLSIRIIEVADGNVVLEGRPGRQHLHGGEVVHGGYALTMIDGAAGAAANTLRPAESLIGTIETKVNLLRPITVDTGPVRATGRVVSASRRIIVAEARLTALNGDLLAFGTSTLMLTQPRNT